MTRKKKSERFALLRKIADQYEQQAAQKLGQSQGNLTQQRQRLEELLRFRADYQQQFQHSGAQGMDGASVQAFQRFMVQLDQAIAQQEQTIRAAEQDCSSKRTQWQEKHKNTRIYDKTIERFTSQEQTEEARREQRVSDDRPQPCKDKL